MAAGTWTVFENSGAFPRSLQYRWRDVFTQWLPSNPYPSRSGPEILRVRLSPDGERADAEPWIPVERSAPWPGRGTAGPRGPTRRGSSSPSRVSP